MARHRYVWLSIPVLIASLVLVALVVQPAARAETPAAVGKTLPVLSLPPPNMASSPALYCPVRWSSQPVPAPAGESSPQDMLNGVAAISSTDVWAVGSDSTATGTLTEHWNGVSWSVVSSPAGSVLNAVAGVASNDVWAVGYRYDSTLNTYQTLAEHWNGSSWSTIATPNDSTSANKLSGVTALSSSDVWAVGSALDNHGSNIHALIEHWNGSSWSIVPASSPGTGIGYLVSAVTAVTSNDVWAVGEYASSQGDLPLTEHWNGTSWSIVPSPGVSGASLLELNAIAATSMDDVWAAGDYNTSNGGPWKTLTEHWNGTNWSVVPSPNPGTPGTDSVKLYGMAAPTSGSAWAVGVDMRTNGEVPLIEHWNGSAWSLWGAVLFAPFAFLDAAAVVAGNTVMAVGEVTPQGALPSFGLAEYYAPACIFRAGASPSLGGVTR